MRMHTFAALTALSVLPGPALSNGTSALVGPLQSSHGIDGCSWSASSPKQSDRYIFVAEYDLSAVYMKIDGEDRLLRLDPRQSKGSLKALGQLRREVFTAEALRVEARFKSTYVCPASITNCEITKYDVEFSVTTGYGTQTVKGVGDVGC